MKVQKEEHWRVSRIAERLSPSSTTVVLNFNFFYQRVNWGGWKRSEGPGEGEGKVPMRSLPKRKRSKTGRFKPLVQSSCGFARCQIMDLPKMYSLSVYCVGPLAQTWATLSCPCSHQTFWICQSIRMSLHTAFVIKCHTERWLDVIIQM